MEDPHYIIPDSHYNDRLDAIRYSNITAYTWLSTPGSFQTVSADSYTTSKKDSYKEGYLDAASHYKYKLKMLLDAIERADITVGCRLDKFQLVIDRACKVAENPLNEIQPEEEIF